MGQGVHFGEPVLARVVDYVPTYAAEIQRYVDAGERAKASLPVDVREMDDAVLALHSVADLFQHTVAVVASKNQTQQGTYAALAQFNDLRDSAKGLAETASSIADFVAQQYPIISDAVDQVGLSGLGAFPAEEDGGPPSRETLQRMRASARRELGLAGMGAGVPEIFSSGVRRVRIRTQVTPDFEYVPGAPGEPGTVTQGSGGGAALMQVVKPEIQVETVAGTVSTAPYGKPTANYFPLVVAGAALAAVGVGYLSARGAAAIVQARRQRKNPPLYGRRRRRGARRQRYAVRRAA